MENKELTDPFSKSLLTGLFAGIAATLCCFAFALLYREITGFILTAFINVSVLIFACNLVLLSVGMIHFVFQKYLPGGTFLYILTFGLLTAWCIWKVNGIMRTSNYEETLKFRGMLTGILLIVGTYASIIIPLLSNNRKFQRLFI